MLANLLAVSWQPEIRGYLVVLVMVVTLIGSTYLILGTNLGARLGFMVAFAGLAGWMMSMAIIWAVYGIGLKGPEPTWQPASPATIVRDGSLLDRAEVIETSVDVAGLDAPAAAKKVSDQMVAEGWTILDEADPRRGQAVASADEIIQIEAEEFAAGEYTAVNVYDKGGERYPLLFNNEALDFLAFWHKPKYAIVELGIVNPVYAEPGRAPRAPTVDESKQHIYVKMLRDLGDKRKNSAFVAIGSTIIFGALCWMLHKRDRTVKANQLAKA